MAGLKKATGRGAEKLKINTILLTGKKGYLGHFGGKRKTQTKGRPM